MDKYHKNTKRMANGLAYHFVINNGTAGRRDGEVEVGRRWEEQLAGGHVRQKWLNESGIGICLVGNFNRTSPTRAQMKSLEKLVNRLCSTYGIPPGCVKGHKDFDGERTVCPGKNFPMAEFRRQIGKQS